jgi:hypothetical protein
MRAAYQFLAADGVRCIAGHTIHLYRGLNIT